MQLVVDKLSCSMLLPTTACKSTSYSCSRPEEGSSSSQPVPKRNATDGRQPTLHESLNVMVIMIST